MAKQADPIMNHVEYAEILVGKALEFNCGSKATTKIRKMLLLSALQELQAEMGKSVTAVVSLSE